MLLVELVVLVGQITIMLLPILVMVVVVAMGIIGITEAMVVLE
jgi:hypothetical protein